MFASLDRLEVGCVFRTIWIVDAHRDDGKRFVVHADEKLMAFVELGLTIVGLRRIGLTA
jgi:hypothetical protein